MLCDSGKRRCRCRNASRSKFPYTDLVTFNHGVMHRGGGEAVRSLFSFLPPRVRTGGHMPSSLRIYPAPHHSGDVKTITPAMQVSSLEYRHQLLFGDHWEDCLTLVTVVRRVCGEHSTKVSSHRQPSHEMVIFTPHSSSASAQLSTNVPKAGATTGAL